MTEHEQSPDTDGRTGLDRDDETHSFVDQSKIDFDPDAGLYSGTAVEGNSEIPGPHIDAESGELTGMDEVRKQAEEAGVDPSDTPAAKSPVARAAEAKNDAPSDGDEQPSDGDEQA